MIQLAMVAVPPSQERIKAISQVGATEVIYYTMGNESDKFEGISEFVAKQKRMILGLLWLNLAQQLTKL